MSDRLEVMKNRLVGLQLLKTQEEALSFPSYRYLEDLDVSINRLQAQIRQLTFSRQYPLVMVNGASV